MGNILFLWYSLTAAFGTAFTYSASDCTMGAETYTINFPCSNTVLFCSSTRQICNNAVALGIKVWNLKMDFNTGGAQRRVKQWTLIITFHNSMISLNCLVTKHVQSSNFREDGRFFNFEHVLWLNSTIKWNHIIINRHNYQCSLFDPTLSTSSVKINFQISDFDTYCVVVVV